MGPYDTSAYYMEHKYQQAVGMENARKVIADIAADFEAMSGRKYDYIEKYRMDDADFAIVIIGSSAGTAKDAVDELRSEGVKAGLVKIRVYRPFPAQEIADALALRRVGALRQYGIGIQLPAVPRLTGRNLLQYQRLGWPWLAPNAGIPLSVIWFLISFVTFS